MPQVQGQKMFKWVIIGVIAVVVLWFVGSLIGAYNSFITLNEQADGQWAQVENAYQRRFDLIPQLVNSTKGFLKQEQTIFGQITDARTAYNSAVANKDVGSAVAAANQLEGFLGRLLAIVEDNPEIQSQNVVIGLMAQLEGTENRINVERNRFNDTIKVYNIKVKRFPSNIIASIFGFAERGFFEAAVGAEKAPDVVF